MVDNILVFEIIFVFICLFIVVVLFYIERKHKRELYSLGAKKKIVEYYLHKVSNIERMKDNNKKLEEIKNLSKRLFNEYYGLEMNTSYSVLINFFNERNNGSLKDFSETMLNCYYRSKQADGKTISHLIFILKKEILNIPLDKGVKKNDKIVESKLKKEKRKLIEDINSHIKNKNHSAAENTYYKLEEVNDRSKHFSKIGRIYDKIIKLYYKRNIFRKK